MQGLSKHLLCQLLSLLTVPANVLKIARIVDWHKNSLPNSPFCMHKDSLEGVTSSAASS